MIGNEQNSAAALRIAALQWYVAQGVDEALVDQPVDRTALPKVTNEKVVELSPRAASSEMSAQRTASTLPIQPKSELYSQAVALASAAQNLEQLREAIAQFDGIALKKTATNLVFADGNANAPIMLIGEAPGADEDRLGKPFVGVSGQLLDKILACIDLDRHQEDPAKALYISNMLNWRPPGNRNPTPGEIELSLPFIERHILLVKPKLLIFCGGVSAKSLLGSDESISKIRKRWHDYMPLTAEYKAKAEPIPAIATYHPSYLLRTPSQKRAVWGDMLTLQEKRKSLGLI